jgi:hypothetical protein
MSAVLSASSSLSALSRISPLARWTRAARRELPQARLEGQPGPWLSVSECGQQVAYFHQDEQSAERAVRWLDSMGCGGKGCPRAGSVGSAVHWSMPLD